MTGWAQAHRLPWWAVAAFMSAVMAVVLEAEVLPPVFVLGHHLVGIPARVTLTAAAATCAIGGLLSRTPRGERAGVRPLWLHEAVWCASVWTASAAVYVVASLVLNGTTDHALDFARNVGGLLGVGLLARRLFGTVLGSLVPIAWMMCLLAFGTPDGDAGLSWPTSPLLSAGTTTATLALAGGVLLGLGRQSRN